MDPLPLPGRNGSGTGNGNGKRDGKGKGNGTGNGSVPTTRPSSASVSMSTAPTQRRYERDDEHDHQQQIDDDERERLMKVAAGELDLDVPDDDDDSSSAGSTHRDRNANDDDDDASSSPYPSIVDTIIPPQSRSPIRRPTTEANDGAAREAKTRPGTASISASAPASASASRRSSGEGAISVSSLRPSRRSRPLPLSRTPTLAVDIDEEDTHHLHVDFPHTTDDEGDASTMLSLAPDFATPPTPSSVGLSLSIPLTTIQRWERECNGNGINHAMINQNSIHAPMHAITRPDALYTLDVQVGGGGAALRRRGHLSPSPSTSTTTPSSSSGSASPHRSASSIKLMPPTQLTLQQIKMLEAEGRRRAAEEEERTKERDMQAEMRRRAIGQSSNAADTPATPPFSSSSPSSAAHTNRSRTRDGAGLSLVSPYEQLIAACEQLVPFPPLIPALPPSTNTSDGDGNDNGDDATNATLSHSSGSSMVGSVSDGNGAADEAASSEAQTKRRRRVPQHSRGRSIRDASVEEQEQEVENEEEGDDDEQKQVDADVEARTGRHRRNPSVHQKGSSSSMIRHRSQSPLSSSSPPRMGIALLSTWENQRIVSSRSRSVAALMSAGKTSQEEEESKLSAATLLAMRQANERSNNKQEEEKTAQQQQPTRPRHRRSTLHRASSTTAIGVQRSSSALSPAVSLPASVFSSTLPDALPAITGKAGNQSWTPATHLPGHPYVHAFSMHHLLQPIRRGAADEEEEDAEIPIVYGGPDPINQPLPAASDQANSPFLTPIAASSSPLPSTSPILQQASPSSQPNWNPPAVACAALTEEIYYCSKHLHHVLSGDERSQAAWSRHLNAIRPSHLIQRQHTLAEQALRRMKPSKAEREREKDNDRNGGGDETEHGRKYGQERGQLGNKRTVGNNDADRPQSASWSRVKSLTGVHGKSDEHTGGLLVSRVQYSPFGPLGERLQTRSSAAHSTTSSSSTSSSASASSFSTRLLDSAVAASNESITLSEKRLLKQLEYNSVLARLYQPVTAQVKRLRQLDQRLANQATVRRVVAEALGTASHTEKKRYQWLSPGR